MNKKPLSHYIKNGYRVVYENTQILNDEEVGTQKTVSFLQASDINGYYLNYDLKKVSYTDWERYPKGRITRGEILIEVKGNIEKIALVPDDYPLDVLVSGSLFKFTVNEHITPEVLLIWLTSKYGSYLKNKLKRNVTIHFLGKDDLYNIPVPDFTHDIQEEITKIVKEAHEKQTQSKSFYHQAEQLLLAELGLLDHQIIHRLSFTTTKSAVNTATRYDAEYFQPKYDDIIAKIEQYHGGWDYVKNIVTWKKGIEVGTEAYTEEGKDFVRVSDFSVNGIENVSRKISDDYYQELKAKYQPKKGEILFTKDGTIGICAVMDQDYQGILSGAFLSLSLQKEYQDFEKHCLALIFNSILCKLQVEKLSGGALIAHLKPSDFEGFKIPLIAPATQTRIADLITQSHTLRRESKQLLESAKKMVEDEIETPHIV